MNYPRQWSQKTLSDFINSDEDQNQIENSALFIAVNKRNHAMIIVKTENMEELQNYLNKNSACFLVGEIVKCIHICYENMENQTYKLQYSETSIDYWGILRFYFIGKFKMRRRGLKAVSLESLPEYYATITQDCLTFCRNFVETFYRVYGIDGFDLVNEELQQITITERKIEKMSRKYGISGVLGNVVIDKGQVNWTNVLLLILIILLCMLLVKIW